MTTTSLRRFPHLIAITLTSVAFAACGQGADDEGPRAPVVVGDPLGVAGAHEHGVASLGIAVDGDVITLDLQVPSGSVFGFERAPRSEEERAGMVAAVERLRAGAGDLVGFPEAAGCALESLDQVDTPEIPEVVANGGDDHAEDHDHDHDDSADHDHDDEHDHADDEHDHADDEHDHEDEGADAHEDVRLVATLRCTAPPQGTARLTLSSLLVDLEQVDLTVVTPGGQAAARVPAGATFEL